MTSPVGKRGTATGQINIATEVRAVREALARLGHYTGPLDGAVNEASDTDPTVVAIKASQGGANPDGRVDPNGRAERLINQGVQQGAQSSYSNAENEINAATGENANRGKHVYYNGNTEARGVNNGGFFRLKTQAWTLVIEPNTALTEEQISGNLTTGS